MYLSFLVDGIKPHNLIFPLAYLTGSHAALRTIASRNALGSPDSYTIAWVAALSIKRAAAKTTLGEEYAALTGFT